MFQIKSPNWNSFPRTFDRNKLMQKKRDFMNKLLFERNLFNRYKKYYQNLCHVFMQN